MGIKFCRVCGEVDVSVRDEVDSVIVFGTSVCGRDCVSFCGSVSDSVGNSIKLVVRLLSRDEVCVSVSAGVSVCVCDWVWDGEWVCVSVRI